MVARAYAASGAAVGVVARSADELAETVDVIERTGGTAMAAVADVTDAASVEDAFARVRHALGPIDLLVNNAGILGPIGPTWDVDAAAWWKTMEVNVGGILVCTQLALPEMVARRRGRVLNIASQAGVHRWPLVSAYSVSKAAVVKFTENVAREVHRFGVTVLSVHPGLLPIGMGETGLPDAASANQYEAHIRDWVARELDEQRGDDPKAAARLMIRLARGDGDALTGRHVSLNDDLDMLIDQIDVVRERDLYVLRPEALDTANACRVCA
jgi:NAD(P)-dependent dehydrogenase (short-subunit alcohol dehydrogenase family)